MVGYQLRTVTIKQTQLPAWLRLVWHRGEGAGLGTEGPRLDSQRGVKGTHLGGRFIPRAPGGGQTGVFGGPS